MLHVGGQWRAAKDGRTLDVVNPATEEVIGKIAHAGKADLDEALAAAQKGFEVWRKMSAFDRSKLMRVEPLRAEYRDRDARVAIVEEQGLDAALLFPTLGCGVEEPLRHDAEACHAALHGFNQWLHEDWGFAYQGRLFAAPMMTLMDPALAEMLVIVVTISMIVSPRSASACSSTCGS